MERDKKIIFGLTIGGVLIATYVIYKAIGDYQTSKRIENIDNSLAKLAGTEAWSNKLIDKITLKNVTDKLEDKINNKL